MRKTSQQTSGRFVYITGWLPLLWISLAFLVGILFASRVTISVLTWLILSGVMFFSLVLVRILSVRLHWSLSQFTLFIPLLLVFFFLGAARYQATIPKLDAHHIAWYNDIPYTMQLTGTLVDPPDERDTYTNIRVEVTGMDNNGETISVHGLILARLLPGSKWQYGDVVRLQGHLETPPETEDFSYKDYLAHQNILSYMPDASALLLSSRGGNPILRLIYLVKDKAINHVYQIFPDPEASLLVGILLGNDNALPASLQQAYQNTGTAHIIAISGFNITIIAGLFVTIFSQWLGSRRGAIAAILVITAYTILVGASPSVLRAAIMGGLAIFAGQIGRRQNGLNTLAATAAVMAGFNPHYLWDVGYQLSFSATIGLILYAQPLQDWFTSLLNRFLSIEIANRISVPVSQYMLFTLAAQLTTLPIMAFQFGRISLVSLIANPFILPVQPMLMVLAGIALLLSFLYLPLGQITAWIAWPFAAYTNRMVEFFNGMPHGIVILGNFSFLFVVSFYIILFLITFAGKRLKQILRVTLAPSAITLIIGVAVYLVWTAIFHVPDGNLHLTFLDVGSADAILIQTPTGRFILVDGGSSPSKLASDLGRRLSILDRSIDWMVIASPQEQQVAALPRILDRFPVENVLWSGNLYASYSARELNRWLINHQVPITHASAGFSLDLGEGARLEVCSVSTRGALLLVSWQGFRALLPIGINFDDIEYMDQGKKIGSVTALLLADSGYAPVNPSEWLTNLHPWLIILDVAAGDPDGLPDPLVIDRLAGITLLRTDQNGWINLSTDGNGMWVEVEKK